MLGEGTKLVGRRVSLEEPVEGDTEEEGIRECLPEQGANERDF